MSDKKLKKLIELRNSLNLSQEGFARLLGISSRMQYLVENGYTPASRNYMERVKEAAPNISIDDIFFANQPK